MSPSAPPKTKLKRSKSADAPCPRCQAHNWNNVMNICGECGVTGEALARGKRAISRWYKQHRRNQHGGSMFRRKHLHGRSSGPKSTRARGRI